MGSHSPAASSRAVLEPFADLDPAALAGLSPSSPLTVRSAALSGRHLYLGTGGGKLLLVAVSPPQPPELVCLLPVGPTHPVSAILPLPSIARVLVLSDGLLLLADPLLSRPLRRLGSLRHVAAVAARAPSSPSACSLAASVGKKLLLIDLALRENDELEVQSREIAVVEGVKTLAWVGDSVFVGTSSGYSLFSSSTGQGTEIFALPESSRPPLVRPLAGAKEVMLLVDNVGVVVDWLGQPVGGSLVLRCSPDCIAEMSPYVVVAGESTLDVYRRRNGACVQTVSFAKSSLIVASGDDGSHGEVVVVATPYKVFCYRKVSAEEQIKTLLRRKNYKEAIHLVEELESDGEISKDVISFVHAQLGFLLFFDLRFEDAVNHFLLSEMMQPSEIFPFIMRDPNRWSDLVPRKRYWGLHPPPKPLEEVIDEGLLAVQRALFLKKAGVDTVVDEDFLSNPPGRADLLELAIRNIIRYLGAYRDKSLSSPEMEGVDTLLMYLYRALDLVDDMEKLASSQNSCVVEELESLLDNSGHLRTLAFLYGSKGMCSKALAIWRTLARNYSTGLWKDHANLSKNDSLETLVDKKSAKEIAAIEASKILQASSDQDLVLEHLVWVADIDQELGIAILTSEIRENQLSPGKVIAAIDPEKVGIHQRYLQWLIEDQDCDDPHYHTSYALSLAKSAMEAVHMEPSYGEKEGTDIDSDAQFIYSLRGRLQFFLHASDLYDPEEVLDVIADSELWLEKAILYRKMGQENIVLQILALKLEDSEAAEQYCAEIGRNDAYIQLLDLYLDPQNGKEPMFTAAVRLLHNHGESLNPLQVLERLSPDMPLQLASDTILRMLRARIHHHRQGQIVHNLSRATNLDARLTRLEERSRHVQLTDESICDSCRARLGTKLFVMYPDDSVVCYRCYRNQGDSTSGRGRSFRNGAIFKQSWLVTR